ncbi:helicase domain protein [Nitzschia inconspicua]|uniref:Helicase domain protein n=1 Tax=Nitzschia inconspicua TaxID=303405 RepID=A0A9K3Q7G7_9STRA|nr:helicase domain protein [Nitzschia inconspicua]
MRYSIERLANFNLLLLSSAVRFGEVTAFITTSVGLSNSKILFSSPLTPAAGCSASSFSTAARSIGSALFYGPEIDTEYNEEIFTSPVLKQVAPELIKWKEEYGHPNIPLKNPGGNQCQTLRRLHIQNKLSEEEVDWLESIGFIFHSMEDVYKYADFDELFQRLVEYEAAHPESNFQIPKKCKEDPELGAWVTGIRRLGRDGVNPIHERRLEEIGFAWISTRQCGSKFMTRYRELAEQIEARGLDDVLADPKTVTWIQAQQEVLKRGGLSQTRVHYMGNMFGDGWTTIGKQNTATP